MSAGSSSGCNSPSSFTDKETNSGKVTVFYKMQRVKHFAEWNNGLCGCYSGYCWDGTDSPWDIQKSKTSEFLNTLGSGDALLKAADMCLHLPRRMVMTVYWDSMLDLLSGGPGRQEQHCSLRAGPRNCNQAAHCKVLVVCRFVLYFCESSL